MAVLESGYRKLTLVALALVLIAGSGLRAQEPAQNDAGPFQFSRESGLDILPGSRNQSEPLNYESQFSIKKGTLDGVLKVTATMEPGWHTYSVTQPAGGPMKTSIQLSSPEAEIVGAFQPNTPPHIGRDEELYPGLDIEEHVGTVEWTAPIRFKEGVDAESLTLKLKIRAQVCKESCIPLNKEVSAKFSGSYTENVPQPAVVESSPPESQPRGAPSDTQPRSAPRSSSPESKAAPSSSSATPKSTVVRASSISFNVLILYIALALVGGLILNLMPCVLPVIGLKVLSLTEQAHMHRGAVLRFNLAFAAGLISVFMVLAVLASVFALKWGQQFTDPRVQVSITCGVFAMALSFLGVWEIPLPGFVGRSTANDLQQKKGIIGAFFKGMFTTILSTPCSGPALGAVFATALTMPVYVTYILFFCIGLGMALPYLLIGLFPAMIRFLPKPGAWMETFKHSMGFVLLLTVAWFLSIINPLYFVSTFTLMVGIWLACWLVGRIPATATGSRKLRGWVMAVTTIAAVALIAFDPHFVWFMKRPLSADQAADPTKKLELIDWVPYSPGQLEAARASGKTVMVEFTAQWCPNCKWNMAFAINTKRVADIVEKNDVVPMLADWSDFNDTIDRALTELNSPSIPLVAIYPAGKSKDEVILLRDLISKSQLAAALEKAGPSKNDQTETAMTTSSEQSSRSY